MNDRFVSGIVGAPFGINGFVKIKPLSGETDHFFKLKEVILRLNGLEKTMEIEECSSPASSVLLMRFKGYNNPEEVKSLNGAELLINRNDAAPLQPGEYYIEDLKGLKVIAIVDGADKKVIGRIISIIEGGGGELAEILLEKGEKKLVPFRKEFFPEINPEKGHVILENLWILE